MIRPPGSDGVAFSEGADGDMRHDAAARAAMTRELGIGQDWATVRQVHGSETRRVGGPGIAGEADAVWTTVPGLPVAVFTADCFGVVLEASGAIGVAHCGWRGVAADVVGELRQAMAAEGHDPVSAFIGPGIGPCCFEVGPEVSRRFEAHAGNTTWGTVSVDLPGALETTLDGLDIWSVGACTRHEPGWFSHRRDGDSRRLAAIGWLA